VVDFTPPPADQHITITHFLQVLLPRLETVWIMQGLRIGRLSFLDSFDARKVANVLDPICQPKKKATLPTEISSQEAEADDVAFMAGKFMGDGSTKDKPETPQEKLWRLSLQNHVGRTRSLCYVEGHGWTFSSLSNGLPVSACFFSTPEEAINEVR
jgi:hypothetical protein